MNSQQVLRSTLDAFVDMASTDGLRQLVPQRLLVPYFRGEFNRCVEHVALNQMIRASASSGDRGWYQIGMACRINDTKKVEFGLHATVFEMLTAAWHHAAALDDVYRHLAAQVVAFLVDRMGLDAERLRVTYCDGGDIAPGVVALQDEIGRSAFAEAGISEGNLIPVRGPKNFVLFVGSGERAGPKYEVQYRIATQGGELWSELATAIVDCFLFRQRSNSSTWEIESATSAVAGCAFGLERLVAARQNARGISVSPVLSDLLSAIRGASTQDARVIDLIEGDCLILADLVRSSMFLMADGTRTDEATFENRLTMGLVRRIRRKMATLCFQDWERVLTRLEELVVQHYGGRYPGLTEAKGKLLRAVASLPWPESWNPDSYDPGEEVTQRA